jgi:hypothetical protein
METGTQPIDDGHYIFTDEEASTFVASEPLAKKFLRPYMSGDDFLSSANRWILALQSATPAELRQMPLVKARMQAVRAFRKASKRVSTKAIADYPERYNVEKIPDRPFLAIPEVSSERREYIPIAWLNPPLIPSNKIRFIRDASVWVFGILTSRMHMVWTRFIGGRLKSDYQYSLGINYNTFPWPQATDAQRAKIETLAKAVLDARARFRDATLADLYDADTMKAELRRAHHALDLAVDRLYRPGAFQGDRDRAEHLFGLYEKLVTPLTAIQKTDKRKKTVRPRRTIAVEGKHT